MSQVFATDLLYYIMDYNGNYYRTDKDDQLVVSDKIEASVFSYVAANSKIGSGIKSKFYFMTPVEDDDNNTEISEETDTTEDAEIMAEKITNILFGEDVEESMTVKDLTESEIIEDIEKNISEYDLSKLDWNEYLTHHVFILSNLAEYRSTLKKAESDVDLKICDVLHYIELCDMDTEDAKDLVELLKVLRENRREIKDELMRTEYFQKNVGTSANLAKAKEALKSVKGLDTRKYTPRKFAELFEGSVIQKRKRPVKTEYIEPISPDNREDNYYEEEQEPMEYIRRETPFDGKENDWMDFALKQVKFYKNANQYIINIKLDIDEIDDSIDDLMEEIENTSCNVTQGYKMLKRLKELRLQRKQKEKELECLYILTEHFDVTAMAEECERNVEDMESFLFPESVTSDEKMADDIKDEEIITEIA